ncbi:MAG: hypothetical protein P4L77_14760 [Sulfuriferula sp.]|nr:hypothetical protein [Sulfuriferula sp.]
MQPHHVTAIRMDFCELADFDFGHFQQGTASKHDHCINSASGSSIKHLSMPVRSKFGYDGSASELAWSLYLP